MIKAYARLSEVSDTSDIDYSDYIWYTYWASNRTMLTNKKNKSFVLKKGDEFGIRKASTKFKVILPKFGEDFLLTKDSASLLIQRGKRKFNFEETETDEDSLYPEYERLYKLLIEKLKKNPPISMNRGWVVWAKTLQKLWLSKSRSKNNIHLDDNVTGIKVLPTILEAMSAKVGIVKLRKNTNTKTATLANGALKNANKRYKMCLSERDLDTLFMNLGDAADVLDAACSIYEYDGSTKSKREIRKITELDTDVREEFSESFWKWVVTI